MSELAEVFRRYGPQYREKFGDKILLSHRRAMRAIEQCRPPALGGHVCECPDCGETQYFYHSCRNRHCPKCQTNKAQQWLEQQKDMLLPVPYFLLTFTLPEELRRLARKHQRLFYNLLFRTAAAAVQKLARDARFIGGQVGLIGVLHTWGRNMSYHPHVHFWVPAGGLSDDGPTWLPARKNFLLPVKALSPLFRAKFRDALKKRDGFNDIPAPVWQKEWVVHCQAVGTGQGALKYLAPYIFRVAISNNRILKVENDQVTFRYRDADDGQAKLCTLDALEFTRRFLQHVLPKGFVKVRYYGLFSPGMRPRLAALARRLALSRAEPPADTTEQQDVAPSPSQVVYCPSCGQVMQRRPLLPTRGRSPP